MQPQNFFINNEDFLRNFWNIAPSSRYLPSNFCPDDPSRVKQLVKEIKESEMGDSDTLSWGRLVQYATPAWGIRENVPPQGHIICPRGTLSALGTHYAARGLHYFARGPDARGLHYSARGPDARGRHNANWGFQLHIYHGTWDQQTLVKSSEVIKNLGWNWSLIHFKNHSIFEIKKFMSSMDYKKDCETTKTLVRKLILISVLNIRFQKFKKFWALQTKRSL